MEAVKKLVHYNHLIRWLESCTYQDMSEVKLTHYHGNTMEAVFQKSKVWKIRKWEYRLKSNIVWYEILNSQFKDINSQFEKEFDDKVKYAIWNANKYVKNNNYLNFYSKYEIVIISADDSNELLVATLQKIETNPVMWGLWILGMLLFPFVAIYELIKLFFTSLFFITENKLWWFVMWMWIIAVSSYYASSIGEWLIIISQELAKLKELWII